MLEIEEIDIDDIEEDLLEETDDIRILEELTRAELLLEKIQNSNLVNKDLIEERQKATIQGLLLAFEGYKKGLEYWRNLNIIKSENYYLTLSKYGNV